MRYEKDEIENRIKIKKKKEKIIICLLYIIIIPIIFSYVIFVIQTIFEPDTDFAIFGLKQYTIVSNSMNPIIKKDDLIFVKEYNENEIHEQDVITFKRDNEIITHRVVKIEKVEGEIRFFTKGDYNNIEDKDYVTYDMIKGKYVFKIAGIGKLMLLLKRTDLFLLILIILFTLYLYERRINKKRIKRHYERLEYERNNEKQEK